MNCFVIMPFNEDFDDVYEAIKNGVENALAPARANCFRLDEFRPAGRITDRLLHELRAATLCIADLSGTKPNVMWEAGFAMALGKPTVLIVQDLADLPFDLKDMQTVKYDRRRLQQTLSQPLRTTVIHTVRQHPRSVLDVADGAQQREDLIGALLGEVQQLKQMVAESVNAWGSVTGGASAAKEIASPQPVDLKALEGAWIDREDGTHYYAKLVGTELVVPYCYRGDTELTGTFYGWRRLGQHWFGRFRWISGLASGFAFLAPKSQDVMTGAYWLDDNFRTLPDTPPREAGVTSSWHRQQATDFPAWALDFLADVKREGLASLLTHAPQVRVKKRG